MRTLLRLVLLVAFLVSGSAGNAAILYGSLDFGGVYRFGPNPANDWTETFPDAGSIMGTYTVAYQPELGRLYVFYEDPFEGLMIQSLDPDDGTSVTFATDGPPFVPNAGFQLAWNAAAGNFFFVDQNSFGTMSTSGVFSVIASRTWSAIAHADGRWLAGARGRLVEIDPGTGLESSSVVLSTIPEWGISGVRSLATDPDTGALYGIAGLTHPTFGTESTLVLIDPVTGFADPVGFIGTSRFIAGIAFVPEPSTALLLALGLLLLRRRT
jgi:hypothetical protein